MNQLERDIANNAYDRHFKWMEDTLMRCHVARLDQVQSTMLIAAVLINFLTDIFYDMDTTEDDFTNMMRQYYRSKALHEAQKKA